jgi:hypothetical protein
MGLDMSHGAYSGGYTGFSIIREILCRAAGWPKDGPDKHFEAQSGSRVNWEAYPDVSGEAFRENVPEDPLICLAAHSDCDGILPVNVLEPLADRIDELTPAALRVADAEFPGWRGELPELLADMALGFRAAAENGEDVEFM